MFAELKNPSRVVVTSSWCVNNLIYEFLKARTMVSSSIVPLLKVTVSSMVSSWQLGWPPRSTMDRILFGNEEISIYYGAMTSKIEFIILFLLDFSFFFRKIKSMVEFIRVLGIVKAGSYKREKELIEWKNLDCWTNFETRKPWIRNEIHLGSFYFICLVC